MIISILGCGWLGLPLAKQLIKNGHTVKGSTTSDQKLAKLKEKGILPFLINLNPELQCTDCDEFWQSDVLVLNIPPGRRRTDIVEFHTQQIVSVIDRVKTSPISFVVFVSSTSVYPEKPGIVEEEDAIRGKALRNSGNALL